jgi:glycosyltransferase involved in cell wall biosynthesis
MQKVSELSVFFPFWNEEKNIKNVVEKALSVVKKVADRWEIQMIDDGSSDGTYEIGRRLEKTYPHVKLISHTPNRGYGAALKEGLSKAKYDLVVFNDGDGQFDFSEVGKLLAKINDNDIVIGYREKRKDSLIRHILMLYLKIHDYLLFGFHYKDIDCGFKLFRKSAIKKIIPLRSEGAMITTEILAKAKKYKLKIAQVGVHHYPRLFGNQSGANLRVLIRALRESFLLWQELHKKV